MRKAVFVVAGLIVIALFLGCGKSSVVPDTVATVNGEPISSNAYLDQVNRRMGQDVLRGMIEQQIVLQWAKEDKAMPTKEQISRQTEALKKDGYYNDQIKALGENGLENEINVTLARANLESKVSKLTDAELKQTYDAMKGRYVHGPRKQVAIIINNQKNLIEKAAADIKKGKDFDQAAAEYASRQFSSRGPIKIWIEPNQPGMPPDLEKAATYTKVGEVSKLFPLAPPGQPTQFAILKVIGDQPKSDVTFEQAKLEVQDVVLYQKSQQDPAFVKKLNEKMKAAKIDVNIPEFKDIQYAFKNPPEPQPAMGMRPGPAPR
jgi:foldase protein PrsA